MRIILISLLTVCTLPVCAQVSIGVVGGYSHTTFHVSDRPPSLTGDMLAPPVPESKYVPKWHAGLIADIHLVKRFYLQPQILISKKGVKMEGTRSYGNIYHEILQGRGKYGLKMKSRQGLQNTRFTRNMIVGLTS